jgi:hypothetical protein
MNTPLPPRPTAALPLRRALVALGLLAALSATAKPGNGNGNGNGKARGQSPDFTPPGLVDKGGIPPGLADKSVPGPGRAPIEIPVLKAPPALRIETPPPRPSVKHVWVPGFWAWKSDDYAWAPGAWMMPPEPAAVWVPPRFEKRSTGNVFVSGFWRL